MARVHVAMLRGEVVRRPADAVGKQTRRQIVAGQPLELADLARPAMVQKGAAVQMVLDSPGISLSAQGQATESGAIGERIHVLNTVSRAIVEGEVVGPNRVRITPSGLPATVSLR